MFVMSVFLQRPEDFLGNSVPLQVGQSWKPSPFIKEKNSTIP